MPSTQPVKGNKHALYVIISIIILYHFCFQSLRLDDSLSIAVWFIADEWMVVCRLTGLHWASLTWAWLTDLRGVIDTSFARQDNSCYVTYQIHKRICRISLAFQFMRRIKFACQTWLILSRYIKTNKTRSILKNFLVKVDTSWINKNKIGRMSFCCDRKMNDFISTTWNT